ncbi:methyltransferase [Candidatus Planktophila sulfonica]|uniref:Methyltransferase n=2 Tax=Candidatus Planktophila sulfonica TaxID=1884904 RepID=A0A249KEZ6_9ACTN|nr:methyltransferase [Candidatus Planktophila sulfonica]
MIVEKNINWEYAYEKDVTSYENQKIVTAIAHHQSRHNSSFVTVLDFGGGGGHSFEIAQQTFKKISMKWVVVEREKIVKMLTNRISRDGLSFASSIEEAKKMTGNVDLIFCNSALQYTDAPLDSLENLLRQNAKTVFLTRSPFAKGKDAISYIQPSLSESNGPGHPPRNLHSVLEGYKCKSVPIEEVLSLIQKYYREVKVFDEGRWEGARSAKLINSYTILATNPILI